MTAQHKKATNDPWRAVLAGIDQHRAEHGCWAYPHADGRLLGVLAAATHAKRILELGTALGYTALWLAHGAPAAHVDTLERDPQHVALARAAIEQAGYDARIQVHEGDFATLLPTLQPAMTLLSSMVMHRRWRICPRCADCGDRAVCWSAPIRNWPARKPRTIARTCRTPING